ncbi:bifunctional TH2 protein, mitochondrial-like isoform X2 [Aristolochia californica]|uniref:bifunctional TH2 protein, mitochondrial-like isoform X2 n=1 Tax=Aristolochia californica TaxID=171875 RepID=UPI0035E32E11
MRVPCAALRRSLNPHAILSSSVTLSWPPIRFRISDCCSRKLPLLSAVRFLSGRLGDRCSISSPTTVSGGTRVTVACQNLDCSDSQRMGVVASEDGAASRFWIKFRDDIVFAFFTPFVVCLAAGNLDIEMFRNYIAQDVHFLKAFAQAYEMAEDCADDDDAKAIMRRLRKDVLEELKMHDSVVQEWGVDLAKEIVPNSATLRYTDFLLATASGKVEGGKGPAKIATPFEKTKIAAYTIGAMTPCMRLYAFLGKELQTFASTLKIEDLLDKLSISLTGEELEVIERLYHLAIKHEVDFFCAQPLSQRSVVPFSKVHDPANTRLMIFSDFDLTCTVVDSSAILAEIAILTAPKTDQNDPDVVLPRMLSVDLRNSWDGLSTQYTEEYEKCIEDIMPSEKVSFNYEGLCKALEQLSEFEKRANSRVVESEVLKGLNLEDIKKAGERLRLQEGCTKFFQQVVKIKEQLNADVHVLSYCWCGDLIRAAFSSGGLTVLNVHSNEFIYEESISTGAIDKKMETPIDKVQAFKDILNNCSDSGKYLSVYIGDSVGDLLCMLEADVGIVIGSSASLRKVANQFGISFVPLFSGVVKKQREFVEEGSNWKGLSGVLYTVGCWAEIHAFILGAS